MPYRRPDQQRPRGIRAQRGPVESPSGGLPTLLAFYVGKDDTRFRAENVRLAQELTAAKVPHLFRLYPGSHSLTLWQREATPWLTLALDRLQTATPG